MEEAPEAFPWVVEPLDKSHDRGPFSCGNQTLDDYLKNQASQDARRHVAVSFVLVEPENTLVLGYYTLSAFGIDLDELPQEIAKKLPRYPLVPATLLGRLAVDRTYRGQGLGEFLLLDALARALSHTHEVASTAVIVDALNDDARKFYLHFDFIALPATPNRLFIPIASIARLFQ